MDFNEHEHKVYGNYKVPWHDSDPRPIKDIMNPEKTTHKELYNWFKRQQSDMTYLEGRLREQQYRCDDLNNIVNAMLQKDITINIGGIDVSKSVTHREFGSRPGSESDREDDDRQYEFGNLEES